MEIKEIGSILFQYGGTVLMALLFVYFVIQDRTKNSALLEEIRELVKTLKVSNENIAHTLDLLQSGCEKLDDKADRNFEAIKFGGKKDDP